MTQANVAVWAINPFEAETRPDPDAIRRLNEWVESTGSSIQPVHVLYVSAAEAAGGEQGEWVKRYVPAVEAELRGFLKGIELPRMKEPRVILQRGGLNATAADLLVQYAQDIQAGWIIVSSKGLSGVRRLALGSFAESLLVRSPVPVWVFGHGKGVGGDPKHLFFPTDCSTASEIAFRHVVSRIKRLGGKITLFHCVELPDPALSTASLAGLAGIYPLGQYIEDQTAWAKKCGAEWTAIARESGVDVEVIVRQIVPNVSAAIVEEAAAAHAGIIALASRSGRFEAALLGSHARQVIRRSEGPVWVYGPKWLGLTEHAEAS